MSGAATAAAAPRDRLERDSARGVRARAILEDPLVAEAFAAVERGILDAWRATPARDVTGRERLFLAVGLLGRVRQALTAVVETGRLADHSIAALRRGERPWPWG